VTIVVLRRGIRWVVVSEIFGNGGFLVVGDIEEVTETLK
jgi:hypothetical protein